MDNEDRIEFEERIASRDESYKGNQWKPECKTCSFYYFVDGHYSTPHCEIAGRLGIPDDVMREVTPDGICSEWSC